MIFEFVSCVLAQKRKHVSFHGLLNGENVKVFSFPYVLRVSLPSLNERVKNLLHLTNENALGGYTGIICDKMSPEI